jgi:adenine deaminase
MIETKVFRMSKIVKGQLADIHSKQIYPAEISIDNGLIVRIERTENAPPFFIMPGLVDAHVHIESSMLAPSEFAPLALVHGTLATVSDPHEIANVLGKSGVEWMAENGKSTPLHFHFGAPSCVPATIFETAGANLTVEEILSLFESGTCHYLAEMMNWQGVLFEEHDVMSKIRLSQKIGKPVDGHAPGLRGEQAKNYFKAGIETDHECFTLEEAMEKASLGVKILIREGSAARNFDDLIEVIRHFPRQVMLCSDDKHPDDLVLGHINRLVARALKKGYDFFELLRAATINPVLHYKLPLGLLKEGDSADFIVVENLEEMKVLQTWRKGELICENGHCHWIPNPLSALPNQFFAHFPEEEAYCIPSTQSEKIQINCIEALEGQLITKKSQKDLSVKNGMIQADPDQDVLHISVINRYAQALPANAFISGFGLKEGAIASSVAHDSHNVVVVGTSPFWMKKACDLIMKNQGGISLVNANESLVFPLPIAGLMSDKSGLEVAKAYEKLNLASQKMGAIPKAPFMLLSFLALLVIPELKLSDKGLFDGLKFEFCEVKI